jgi:polyhydroxybutyrate depolymerase
MRWILVFALVIAGCGDDADPTDQPGNASTPNATTANATTPNSTTPNSSTPNLTDADAGMPNNSGTSDDAGTGDDAGTADVPEVLAEGTARETRVFVPSDYDPNGSYPLVILLHGYSASGFIQDQYFGISAKRDDYGFVFLRPDGTQDQSGNRFWNATEWCCDFNGSGVDDEAFLTGLIDEAVEKLAVDPKRVYMLGHSNGGFMSFRMACNQGEKLAAIVSLAGGNFLNPDNCTSETPVAVAHAHGTLDATIPYDGNQFVPSAVDSVAPWATRNGCASDLTPTGDELDLDSAAAGFETNIDEHADCSSGFAVELWTMDQSAHIPTLTDEWSTTVLDFLFQFERP